MTQPFLRFWVSQVHISLSQRNVFVSSPCWIFISSPVGFVVCPVEHLLLGLTRKFIENLKLSLLSRAVPNGVLRQSVRIN